MTPKPGKPVWAYDKKRGFSIPGVIREVRGDRIWVVHGGGQDGDQWKAWYDKRDIRPDDRRLR